jgi:transposase
MSRLIPPEKKTRIVLAILAGEMSIAEAARKEKVSEQSIGRWKAEFIEACRTALVAGRSGPSSREEQLEAEVVELTQALGEGARGAVGLEKARGGPVGLLEDLEVIRTDAAMSTARFCRLLDIPERIWRRKQARARIIGFSSGPWPRPARDRSRQVVADLAWKHLAVPASRSRSGLETSGVGHRKIWAMARHGGHQLMMSTVLRILRDEGCCWGRQRASANRRPAPSMSGSSTSPSMKPAAAAPGGPPGSRTDGRSMSSVGIGPETRIAPCDSR